MSAVIPAMIDFRLLASMAVICGEIDRLCTTVAPTDC